MRLRSFSGALMLLVVFALCSSRGAAVQASTDLDVSFDHGLRMKSADGDFAFKMGGRVYFDWVYFNEDDDYLTTMSPIADGTEFRTARVYMSGTIYENVEFKGQYDLSGGAVKFKDVYFGIKKIPGTQIGFRVGHFKQPFGMSETTSSKYISFMERPMTAGFAPSRKSGMMLHGLLADGRATWAASVYRNSNAQGKVQADGEYNGAARLTFEAWKNDEGDAVHLGAAVTRRSDNSDATSFALQPEAHLAPAVGEINVPAKTWDLFDFEFAATVQRFSLQSEYLMIQTQAPTGSEDASFDSYYVQGGVFLTGEHRPYKHGNFSRVSPRKNVTADGGSGAVELLARYGRTDLSDTPSYDAGKLTGLSFGLNWYLNPNSRVMLNVVRSRAETPAVDGAITAFMTRFQIDF
jgi:phosphate-selective porin OprO/OprP